MTVVVISTKHSLYDNNIVGRDEEGSLVEDVLYLSSSSFCTIF